MRQAHVGGDKLFVDYAGDTVLVIIDRLTGQVRAAQIFVAVLGASNFTYAEASWTQSLADWIGAHTRAFAALGGAPKLLVPDNTKVAVIKACLYEPQVNRTYAEMAAHYDTAVLPARPRRPRDKAKVEVAVLIIERWLLGRLRHRRFCSLAELDAARRDSRASYRIFASAAQRGNAFADPFLTRSRGSLGIKEAATTTHSCPIVENRRWMPYRTAPPV
jgi:transposase